MRGKCIEASTTVPRKLHIGGHVSIPGWEILDVNAAPYVDHVCNAKDLSIFPDNSFSEIYASHVVEHFDYSAELLATLKEWRRVLALGGKVCISVPDMDVLARLFLSKDRLSADDRFMVMRMMFGGHMDAHDYHVVGLNEEFLRSFLHSAGYINIRKVDGFGLFEDTSAMEFGGVAISLNMIAEKPPFGDVGRNDPCPCGSGKRLKHCHGNMT